MNQEQENFEDLRRLLALKRHEQPPPGYFHHFSGNVISRIRAGETGEASFSVSAAGVASWLQRFWAAVESKPMRAGGFGVAVCALLISGLIYSGQTDSASLTSEMPLVTPVSVAQQTFSPPSLAVTPTSLSSTAPVADYQPSASLFQELRNIQPVPASYSGVPVSFHPNP